MYIYEEADHHRWENEEAPTATTTTAVLQSTSTLPLVKYKIQQHTHWMEYRRTKILLCNFECYVHYYVNDNTHVLYYGVSYTAEEELAFRTGDFEAETPTPTPPTGRGGGATSTSLQQKPSLHCVHLHLFQQQVSAFTQLVCAPNKTRSGCC